MAIIVNLDGPNVLSLMFSASVDNISRTRIGHTNHYTPAATYRHIGIAFRTVIAFAKWIFQANRVRLWKRFKSRNYDYDIKLSMDIGQYALICQVRVSLGHIYCNIYSSKFRKTKCHEFGINWCWFYSYEHERKWKHLLNRNTISFNMGHILKSRLQLATFVKM